MHRIFNGPYRVFAICVVLAVTVIAAFHRVPQAGFINYDDHQHVYDNPLLNPVTTGSIAEFWKFPSRKSPDSLKRELSPNEVLYAPATFTLWAGIAHFARSATLLHTEELGEYYLRPQPYHAVSLALHVLNVLLVFLILGLLVRQDWAAAAGALLFGVHPVQVEPVAWVSATNNLLSGAFGLFALWQYLLWIRPSQKSEEAEIENQQGASDRWRRCLRYGLATLCFALALLSKPSVATLPAIAFVLAIWQRQGEAKQWSHWRPIFFSLVPWLVLAAAVLLVTRSIQQELAPASITQLWQRPLIAGDALTFYLWKILVPFELVSHYGRTPQWVLSHWWGYVNWLIPAAGVLLLWRLHRQFHNRLTRNLIGGTALFLVIVAPMTGIVPYYFHSISVVADRYLYLAMIGPSLALAGVLGYCVNSIHTAPRKNQWPAPFLAFIGVWLLLLGAQTYRQTGYWQNSHSLWSHLLRVNPQSSAAYAQLGAAQATRSNWDKAEEYYLLAAEYIPATATRDAANIQTNLGSIYARQQRWEDAIARFRRSVELDPTLLPAYSEWGNVLRETGNFAQAEAVYLQALQISSRAPTIHYNLALLLMRQNKPDEAEQHLHKALVFTPKDAETHNALGLALARQGKTAVAVDAWRTALQLDPALADAHTNLGTALAMQGELSQAIGHWQEALRLNPKVAQTHFNLGMALYQQGKTSAAVEHWKEALRLEPEHAAAKNALESVGG